MIDQLGPGLAIIVAFVAVALRLLEAVWTEYKRSAKRKRKHELARTEIERLRTAFIAKQMRSGATHSEAVNMADNLVPRR